MMYKDDPSYWGFFQEVFVHECLHSIDVNMNKLGYADELVPSPDGGRDEGWQPSGDPVDEVVDGDYRRPLGETTWYGYYAHIMQEHVTSKMWSEASLRDP